MPAEFRDQTWDFSTFGRGERFVAKTIPDAEFDEIVSQAGRWGLDDFMQEKDWRKLLHAPA